MIRNNLSITQHGRFGSSLGPFQLSWVGKSQSGPPKTTLNVDGIALALEVWTGTGSLIQRIGYIFPGGLSRNLQAERVPEVEEVAELLGNNLLRVLSSLYPIPALRGYKGWGKPLAQTRSYEVTSTISKLFEGKAFPSPDHRFPQEPHWVF